MIIWQSAVPTVIFYLRLLSITEYQTKNKAMEISVGV